MTIDIICPQCDMDIQVTEVWDKLGENTCPVCKLQYYLHYESVYDPDFPDAESFFWTEKV